MLVDQAAQNRIEFQLQVEFIAQFTSLHLRNQPVDLLHQFPLLFQVKTLLLAHLLFGGL